MSTPKVGKRCFTNSWQDVTFDKSLVVVAVLLANRVGASGQTSLDAGGSFPIPKALKKLTRCLGYSLRFLWLGRKKPERQGSHVRLPEQSQGKKSRCKSLTHIDLAVLARRI